MKNNSSLADLKVERSFIFLERYFQTEVKLSMKSVASSRSLQNLQEPR